MISKRTAAITALSFIAAALTACGHDPLMEDEIEIPEPVTTYEHTTEAETEPPTEEETTEAPQPELPNVKLATGGDTFTVLAWNPDDAPMLIANWLGVEAKDVRNGKKLKTPSGVNVDFICLGTSGYYAAEEYDKLFNSGEDIDVYLCEPDWVRRFTDDDTRSAPMSVLGITEDMLGDMYPYTVEQCKNSRGELKALAWDASPGCFAYNAELAKEYLGAETPEEMQSLVGSWDRFTKTAETVAEKSKNQVALADSLGGMWQAYSSGGFSTPLVLDNQPVIGDEVKEFADMAKKLWDCGGVSRGGQWTDDWLMAGQKGSTMGYFIPAWGFGNGAFGYEATGGDTLGQWALCEGPQAYWWGGNVLAVNPTTDNGAEVYEFINSSVLDLDHLVDYMSQSSYLPNSKAVVDYMKTSEWEPSDDFKASDELWKHFQNGGDRLDILDRNAKAIDLSNKITKYDSDISYAMFSAIEYKYIRDGKSWEETVEFMQDDIACTHPELY